MSASAEPAVPLLSGLLADAEDLADLRPGVVEEAQVLDVALDVAVDVLAAGDEGLELGLEAASHASRIVDAWGIRQGLLTHVASSLGSIGGPS